ncbi:PREDICTED: uncharacterized protein LOC104812967 [Tarenaya hassleriana]|uniref:uncharacterized protein LOC104812967 n=1 Tax=Tarenaya hassleriana TaxID=28532 RepID=UPI00053C6B35|nr:PREDICTED: uncharacterized protein LOC104812967 [Tarenaya hassleriana]
MGNCVCMRQQATKTWSGDEWGSFSSKHKFRRSSTAFDDDDDGEGLLDGAGCVTSSFSGGSSSSSSHEIKIRMTKKDLEELMKRISVKGLTAEEILAKLLTDGGDQFSSENQRSWRPALQSIPEDDD